MSDDIKWDVLRTVLKASLKPEKRPDGSYVVHCDNPPLHAEAATLPELQQKLLEQLKPMTAITTTVMKRDGVHVTTESNARKLSWDIQERAGGGFVATSIDPLLTLEADTRDELNQKMLAKFTESTGVNFPATSEWLKHGGIGGTVQFNTKIKLSSGEPKKEAKIKFAFGRSPSATPQLNSSSDNPVVIEPESGFTFQKLAGIAALLFFLFLLWQLLHH